MRKQHPSKSAAAVYVRVSTGGQEEGSSLETQERACREYAVAHGWTVDDRHFYREVHTGTELWERPQLTRMRDSCRRQEFGVVIAYAIDRLARDPTHLGVILTEADHYGVEVEFVSEPLDASPEGELIRYVRGYAAKVEHEKIRERCMRGKLARVQAGKLPNAGGELYGYRRDREKGIRLIVEEQAAVIQRIYRDVVRGVSIRGIIRALNDEGVPSPAAGVRRFADPGRTPRWGKGVLQRILTEPAYKGETWAWRRKRDGSGTHVLRSEEEWIALPEGTTPAIVTPEVWQAAQERLQRNRGEATRNAKRQYLLRGLAVCAKCGLSLYSCPEGDRRTYRCSSKDRPTGPCGGKRVDAEALEAWVWQSVRSVLEDPSIIIREWQRRAMGGPDPEAAQQLDQDRKRLAEIQRSVERLVEALADEAMPINILKQQIRRREKEAQVLRAGIAEIEAQIREQEALTFDPADVERICRRVVQRIEQLGFEGRRLALEALAVRVTASGCGRRGSPLSYRLEGCIPVLPEDADLLESGVLTTTSGCCGPRPPLLPALVSRAPGPARR